MARTKASEKANKKKAVRRELSTVSEITRKRPSANPLVSSKRTKPTDFLSGINDIVSWSSMMKIVFRFQQKNTNVSVIT